MTYSDLICFSAPGDFKWSLLNYSNSYGDEAKKKIVAQSELRHLLSWIPHALLLQHQTNRAITFT